MNLLQMFKAQHAKEAQNRAAMYREVAAILERRADPRKPDAARLAELCATLGIDAAHIEWWAFILDEAANMKRAEDEGVAVDKQMQQILAKVSPLEKSIGEARSQIERLLEPFEELRLRKSAAATQAERLAGVRLAIPWLFGNMDSKPTPALLNFGEFTDKQRQLKIKDALAGSWLPTTDQAVEGGEVAV